MQDDKENIFTYPQDVIDDIRTKAVDKVKSAKHEWKQKGIWVYCKSCEHEHGFFVGTNKMLIGIDDNGNPKLVTIK